MRGVVLAGGTGSRLQPLTTQLNKHVLPVGRVPMIYHPVQRLIEADIWNIAIVTGTEHIGSIVGCLGSGKNFGCSFTYRVQDEAGGIAQALGLVEDFAHGDDICVVLGDNIFNAGLTSAAKAFQDSDSSAHLMLTLNSHTDRFGVAICAHTREQTLFDHGETISKIIEKPSGEELHKALLEQSRSSCAVVTGIYFYDHTVFEVIRRLHPSNRNELEITDVNNHYVNIGKVSHSYLPGWWTDAGTHESYAYANQKVNADVSVQKEISN